jgi:hypothetical protein
LIDGEINWQSDLMQPVGSERTQRFAFAHHNKCFECHCFPLSFVDSSLLQTVLLHCTKNIATKHGIGKNPEAVGYKLSSAHDVSSEDCPDNTVYQNQQSSLSSPFRSSSWIKFFYAHLAIP